MNERAPRRPSARSRYPSAGHAPPASGWSPLRGPHPLMTRHHRARPAARRSDPQDGVRSRSPRPCSSSPSPCRRRSARRGRTPLGRGRCPGGGPAPARVPGRVRDARATARPAATPCCGPTSRPRTTLNAGASPAVTGYTPANLQAAYGLAAAAAPRRRGRHGGRRGRLRLADRRGGPRHLPGAVRPARVHHRQRLLPQGGPERRRELPDRRTAAGRWRSPSTWTWCPRSAPTARSCSSRLPRATSPTSARPRTARSRWAPSSCPTATAAPSTPASRPYDATYFDHPGVAITASSGDAGYGVEFPAASPHVVAVGGTVAPPRPAAVAAGPSPRGRAPAADARSTSPSPRGSTTPAAPTAWLPTCPRSPTRPRGCRLLRGSQRLGWWYLVGGTSASAPIIAAAYALAGHAVGRHLPGRLPVRARRPRRRRRRQQRLLQHGLLLQCRGRVLDGPTGLGSPNGVTSFSPLGAPGKPTAVTAVAGNGVREPSAGPPRRRTAASPSPATP